METAVTVKGFATIRRLPLLNARRVASADTAERTQKTVRCGIDVACRSKNPSSWQQQADPNKTKADESLGNSTRRLSLGHPSAW